MEEIDKGRTSEWNEAQFKSARLNEIQEILNTLWIDPLGQINKKFKHELIFEIIDRLYHEGYSKYSKKEREQVDNLRKIISRWIIAFPPTNVELKEEIGGTERVVVVNTENFNHLKELLLEFERLVKDLNDKHGLTTLNQEDDFGDPYN